MARLRDDQRHVGWQRIAQTILILVWIRAVPASATPQQPLPSWNAGPAKTAILEFVRTVLQQRRTSRHGAEESVSTCRVAALPGREAVVAGMRCYAAA
jgi:hypothetical protein